MKKTSAFYTNVQERLEYLDILKKKSDHIIAQCMDVNLLSNAEKQKLVHGFNPDTLSYEQDELINLILDNASELIHGRECYCFTIKQAQAIYYLSKKYKMNYTLKVKFDEGPRDALGIEYIKLLHGSYENFINTIDIEYIKIIPKKEKKK